jgi:SAM-dependent methyltransferase
MTAPAIFDRPLVRSRFARRDETVCRFFGEHLAAELTDRLALIKRRFASTLVAGPFAPWIAPRLETGLEPGRVIAEGRDIVFDEEALPFADGSLDCVLSILSLQSVNDLPGALIQMRRALKPDGLLLAALAAGESLKELRAAWLAAEGELHGGATPRVAPMVDLREMGGLLQRAGFALPVMDMDRTVANYDSGLALMREIKALGFSNVLGERSRRPVTKALLAKAVLAYGTGPRVPATIDVAWVTAWSPHESQQQPLRPGSAKARLADALKSEEIPLKRE